MVLIHEKSKYSYYMSYVCVSYHFNMTTTHNPGARHAQLPFRRSSSSAWCGNGRPLHPITAKKGFEQ